MSGTIGFLLVDSTFALIFADVDVRSVLTSGNGGGTSFEHGLEVFLAAVQPLTATGQPQRRFEYAGRPWKWTLLPGNGSSGLSQTMHAFLVGSANSQQPSYLSTVAAMYRLTPRETETLGNLVEGLPVKEVAARMGNNPSTAKSLLRNICAKMGVTTRSELMSRVLHMSCGESLQCPFKTALLASPPSMGSET